MRHVSSVIVRIALAASMLFPQLVPVYAQEELHPAATEAISLQVGDIFEILPVHDITDATYTWILTQDRTFLEASRAPSFRKRLIQPGTYTLYAEIASADGSRRTTRTIELEYTARQPRQPDSNSLTASGNLLVTTVPAANADGKIAMLGDKQLVLLSPLNPDITPLSLDLDLNRDANGDGINDNDIQSSETFFHTDATPLYLWITDEPLTTHAISVTAALPDGARTQRLEILSEEIALTQGAVQSPVHIDAKQTGERTYTFEAVFDNPAATAGQLLYQWQFGDGQQSLMTKADHTYVADGTYNVSLLVRNLRDGSDIGSTSMHVTVSADSGAVSSQDSSDSTDAPPAADGTGFNLRSVVMLGMLFLGSILIGILIIWLIGKLRKGKASLADKLETIEQTVVKSPSQEPAPLTIAPPMATVETKRVEPPPAIAEREKEAAVERPAPAPAVKPENTPAWLNAPAASKSASQQAQPRSVATDVAQKPAPAPTPAPVQTPAPKPAAAPARPQAPSWLQQSATPKPAPVQTQPAAKTPPAPVIPASAPQQAPKPVSTPVPPPVAAVSAPVAPTTPKPVQTPAAAPAAPATPTPVVPPAPPIQPAQPTPTPTPAPAPAAPATPVAPQELDIPAADQPIAIIRAESLNPQEGQNG